MLMNLLTAIGAPCYFTSKTQLQILYSMADLFKNLSPQKYPAFSFAWLELISHKQFLPLFLKPAPNQTAGGQQFFNRPNMQGNMGDTFFQKRFKFKELVVQLLTFLKSNMFAG
jgi:hypothetical protein